MADMVRSFDVVRVRGDARIRDTDQAAAEEPLEIRLHQQPFAVVMRTPGQDRELAAGFLLAERVIASPDDLGTIEHCRDANDGDAANIVNVTLTNDATLDRALSDRRNVTTSSSCGLCGRRTIESLLTGMPPIAERWTVASSVLVGLPEQLRRRQSVFEATGGLHAAALFSVDGRLIDMAEDVGRHNAVDKIIGRMIFREALPLSDSLLCVSGRTSFEIVQKAVLAGVPLVAAVSAPSSLAIELAGESGVTLVGFVRGESFNIYTHPHRVV